MNSKSFILVSALSIGLLPGLALAAPLEYLPLVGIPGIDPTANFGTYINALYGLSIAVAALMAVIKIIIAGVKYMLSDVVTSKQEAIGDINSSLLGLGVVIFAVLFLTIINPQLTETDIFMDDLDGATARSTSTLAVPTVEEGRYAGYTYRPVHPDPGYKNACVAPAYYAIGSGYEICYSALPAELTAKLNGIFGSSYLIDLIVPRFQTAHRPRMIADSRLDTIALDEGTKNRSRDDVLLAVEYIDGSVGTPLFAVDWIDQANLGSIGETCLAFQQALANDTTPVRVKKVGDGGKGYLACVIMP